MKPSRFEQLYVLILAVIFAGIVLHAPLTVGFGVLFPDLDLLIKSWKEILMLVALPLGVVVMTRQGLWSKVMHDPIFYLISLYALLHLVLPFFLNLSAVQTIVGLAVDLRYVLFFSLVYIALLAMPGCRRMFIQIGVVGASAVVGFATLQLFLPADILKYIGYSNDTIVPYLTVDKNPNYIRINSTLRGPNPLGAYAVVVAGSLAAFWATGRAFVSRRRSLIFAVMAFCTVVTLWLSYSRSAWIATAFALVTVLVVAFSQRVPAKVWLVIGVITLAIMGGGLVALRDSDFVSNVILHENPDGGSSISSNDQHAESLLVGLDRMVRQPFGAGIGSTGSASLFGDDGLVLENQYLFIAHESGWIGLGLFLLLFVKILRRLWNDRSNWLVLGVFASGVGLGIIGLIQPVWVDDTVSIVWWGLAAIAITRGGT
jgi:hypothetical protein